MDDLKNERMKLRALENLFAQKRFSDAFTFAEKLTTDYPNSYHIGFIYVKILKELNRLTEAEAAALKLIPLSPDNINLLSELGIIYLKLNKYDESYDYFNKVLFLDPFNNDARESMDKIKDLKNVNAGNVDISPNMASQPINFEETEPKEEPIETPNEEIQFSEPPGPISPLDTIETIETVESFETVESTEPIALTEPGESLSLISMTPAIEKLESMHEMQDLQEMQEVQEMGEVTGIVEVAEIAEIEGISEIPGGVDVVEEVDFMGTQPQSLDSYADFYNQETIESEEENIPVGRALQEAAPDIASEPGNASEFVTESAAILYLSQGLYDDALDTYEKLYATHKEGRFLLKVKQLKAHRVGLEKIRRLNEFLRLIQMKGV